MKVISEMDSRMEREITKISKRPIRANGETILDMDLVNKNSKIENEDTLVLSILISMMEKENFTIKI